MRYCRWVGIVLLHLRWRMEWWIYHDGRAMIPYEGHFRLVEYTKVFSYSPHFRPIAFLDSNAMNAWFSLLYAGIASLTAVPLQVQFGGCKCQALALVSFFQILKSYQTFKPQNMGLLFQIDWRIKSAHLVKSL